MGINNLTSVRTKYAKIMLDIRKKIISGEYAIDSKLPSEENLKEAYKVSRVTIRLAIDGLVKDGIVERVQGKGSFVRKPQKLSRMVRSTTVESFSQVAAKNGFETQTHVLKIEQVSATKKLKNRLQTNNNEVLHILRLRYLDNDPIFIESNFYPLPRFKHLKDFDLHQSLYKIFEEHFDVNQLKSDETTLSIELADVSQASLLKRSVGFPLFFLETQIKDQNDKVVQYGEQLIASDRYKFKI